MFASLRIRLIASYAFVVFVSLFLAGSGFLWLGQQYQMQREMQRLADIVLPLSAHVRYLELMGTPTADIAAFLDDQSQQLSVRLLLVRTADRVVSADTADELQGYVLPPDEDTSQEQSGRLQVGRYQAAGGQVVTISVAGALQVGRMTDRLPPRLAPRLAVMVAVPQASLAAAWLALAPRLVVAGVLALFASLPVALWLSRSISRPLAQLTRASEEMARGNYEQRIPQEGQDEIGRLASAFNLMAKQVALSHHTLRDFLADVSHELRTPLTSIRGFSQAMTDGVLRTPAEYAEAGQVIHAEAERMSRLVESLLHLSRVESGQFAGEHQPLDLAALVAACVSRAERRAALGDVALVSEAQPLPTVLGETHRLEEVVDNLLDNALKHTPDGGRITVRLSVDPPLPAVKGAHANGHGTVRLVIHNTGSVIAPEDQPRVFDRFYRGQSDVPAEGHGLGLSIARQIVEAHGGRIAVASSPQSGTVFTVWLPAAAPPVAPGAKRPRETARDRLLAQLCRLIPPARLARHAQAQNVAIVSRNGPRLAVPCAWARCARYNSRKMSNPNHPNRRHPMPRARRSVAALCALLLGVAGLGSVSPADAQITIVVPDGPTDSAEPATTPRQAGGPTPRAAPNLSAPLPVATAVPPTPTRVPPTEAPLPATLTPTRVPPTPTPPVSIVVGPTMVPLTVLPPEPVVVLAPEPEETVAPLASTTAPPEAAASASQGAAAPAAASAPPRPANNALPFEPRPPPMRTYVRGLPEEPGAAGWIDDALLWLGVPSRTQYDGTPFQSANCGPSALGMILEAYGLRLPTAQLRDYSNYLQGTYGYDDGIALDYLAQIGKRANLNPVGLYRAEGGYRRWSVEDVRASVLKGYPVIALVVYRNLPGSGGYGGNINHYVVISGLLGNDFLYNDSAFGGGGANALVITPDELERAWAGADIPRHAVAFGIGDDGHGLLSPEAVQYGRGAGAARLLASVAAIDPRGGVGRVVGPAEAATITDGVPLARVAPPPDPATVARESLLSAGTRGAALLDTPLAGGTTTASFVPTAPAPEAVAPEDADDLPPPGEGATAVMLRVLLVLGGVGGLYLLLLLQAGFARLGRARNSRTTG